MMDDVPARRKSSSENPSARGLAQARTPCGASTGVYSGAYVRVFPGCASGAAGRVYRFAAGRATLLDTQLTHRPLVLTVDAFNLCGRGPLGSLRLATGACGGP